MISFTCHSCNQPLEVEDAGEGLNVPCPTCGSELTIPPKDRSVSYAPREQLVFPGQHQHSASPELTPARSETQFPNAHPVNGPKKWALLMWCCASVAVMFFGLIFGNGSLTATGFISLCASALFIIPNLIDFVKEQQAQERKRQAEMQTQLDQLIQKHAEALSIKRLQKRRRDDYGNITEDQWIDEKEYFCQKVIRPAFPQLCNWLILDRYTRPPRRPLDARDPGLLDAVFLKESQLKKARRDALIAREALYARNTRESLYSRIDAQIDKYTNSNPITARDISALTPTAFEAYCAQILNDNGWHATTTEASGDQGVDILATRHGRKAVFQCKLYSSQVGNDAVQEAISGKAWASADYAFVVSNADFTPSAKALAAKVGVRLIHYSKLKNLNS